MAKKKATKSKYEVKTKVNDANVVDFLKKVENPKRREDGLKILEIMKEVAKEEPKLWGTSIVGFGSYHYRNKSGGEADWPAIGFSPRKQYLTVYIMEGFEKYSELLDKLGKHKLGKSCLYINKLEDVDIPVLKEIMGESFKYVKENFDYKSTSN